MNVVKAWQRRRKHIRHSRKFAAKYPYMLEPIQLSTLINGIDAVADKPGCIVEIGAYRGWSTMFLCEHILKTYRDDPPTYYAIDTFDSFTNDQLDHEVAKRNKVRKDLEGFFNNDYDIWVSNFRRYPFVTAIKADCAQFDFSCIEQIKVALLDVDLYVPTAVVLPKVYSSLIEGGVILVDDVRNDNLQSSAYDRSTASHNVLPVNPHDGAYPYDGAYHAYLEFCAANQLPPTFIGTKCGVIRR
jgi:hypothetical protein